MTAVRDDDLAAHLRRSELFEQLPSETFDAVVSRVKLRRVRAGQVLFRVNEAGSTFYVILRGAFRLFVPGPRGDEILNDLGSGEWFGEMAVLTGEPRAASAAAIADSEVAEFGRAEFATLSAVPSFTAVLSQMLSHRLRARTLVRPRPPCPHVIAVVSALPSPPQSQLLLHLAAALADVGGGSVGILDHISFLRLARDSGSDLVAVHDGFKADLEAARGRHTFVLLRLPAGADFTTRLLRVADAVWAFDDPQDETLAYLRSISDLPPLTFLRDSELGPPHDPWRTSGDASVIRKAPVVRLERDDPQAVSLWRFARRVLGRRVGLALSAGGAKGLSHLGVLRCLERAGLETDLIAGTSMGGVIGGFAAAGRRSEEMLAVFQELRADLRHRLLDFALPGPSLLRGRKKRALLAAHAGDLRIEALPVPFWAVAGDLVTGREVVLGSGLLAEALDATSAIPVIFPPVIIGEQTLVDGWVVNPLPTDVLRRGGADVVIAVDASGCVEAAADFTAAARGGVIGRIRRRLVNPEVVRIAMRSMEIGARERTIANLALADASVRPDVGRFSPSDIRPMTEIVERGEAAAEAVLPAIRRVLQIDRGAPA